MIKTVLLFSYLGVYLVFNSVILPFWCALFILGLRGAGRGILNLSARMWARHFLFLVGTRVIVEGRGNVPDGGRVCIISNHESILDILVLIAYSGMTPGFVAKRELAFIPVLNFWMFMLHCVFIDRGSVKRSFRSLERGVKSLARGNPMVIFPEGTRSRTGRIGEFRPGSFHLASRAGALILPVTLINTAGVFEKTGRFRSQTVRLVIHAPVPTAGISASDTAGLAEKVRGVILSAYPVSVC
ncbi:MAG: 1-acyl-sn-glycerol-3-phosphate acyltransferase [Spirochaetales bacterium]|nr:1-acyl-sn-glycerol-3-phosphate acyltransferase [Spirochaetales bacterium]